MHDWITKTRDIRATLSVTLNREPGRGRAWMADTGDWRWRATGSTEKAAVDALNAGVTTFLALYRPPTVLAYAGYTAVVSLSTSSEPGDLSWDVTLIGPNGSSYRSTGRASDWNEAEAHARYTLVHAATDWHDDANVHAGAAFLAGCDRFGHGQYGPTELLRYAAWQRAAKHIVDSGIAYGSEAHAWACEHQDEFAVPPFTNIAA